MGRSLCDFQVLSPLGRGAHSYVYHIKTRKDGSEFALKVIERSKLKDINFRRQVLNEIRIHSKLNHSHILKLEDSFEDEDCVYLLLEYCKSGELYSLIRDQGKLTEEDTKHICIQIVEGMVYLHSQGIIHRDLKLGNILISENKTIKLADFGLAIQLEQWNEERDTVCGTPNYIAPEIVDKQKYGMSCDIWALGCVIYACLVGHPPFESQTVQNTFQKARSLKYDIPQDLSKNAKDLISSLLSLNPEERPNIIEVKQHPFFRPSSPHKSLHKMTLQLDTDCSYYEYYEEIPSVSVRNRKTKSVAADLEALRSKTPDPIYCSSPTSKFLVQNKENIPTPRRSLNLRNKKPMSTHNLKPFSHRLKNDGQISIDNSGWAKLVLSKRVLEVSQNGMSVVYNGKACSIHTLSKGAEKMYEYLKEVLELVKSQTPKVIIEQKECRFVLMSNFPNPNFEAYLPDNVQILYQLGSQTMEILQNDTKTTVNPLANTSSATSDQLYFIHRAMEGLHKCVQQEKAKKARSYI